MNATKPVAAELCPDAVEAQARPWEAYGQYADEARAALTPQVGVNQRLPRAPTLAEILDSRERRAARLRVLDAQGGGTVVSLTVNWPGPNKGCDLARAIHRAGVEALEEAFGDRVLYREVTGLPTGSEGFFRIAGTPGEVKGITCGIEDAHMLGRLFDMDVMRDGQPLSRRQLGHAPRRCLICGGETLVCRREKQHTLEELLICIEAMTAAYEAQR